VVTMEDYVMGVALIMKYDNVYTRTFLFVI